MDAIILLAVASQSSGSSYEPTQGRFDTTTILILASIGRPSNEDLAFASGLLAKVPKVTQHETEEQA